MVTGIHPSAHIPSVISITLELAGMAQHAFGVAETAPAAVGMRYFP